LVRGAMLDAFEHGRESERASRDQPIAERVSSHEADLEEMPCVLKDYDPRPVDPVVLEVCELIRRDDFQGANDRWLAVFDERLAKGIAVGGDTLIIARTFDARAKALPTGEAATATVAGYARYWAGEAFNKLPKSDLRQGEARQLWVPPSRG
jgi:hypothetical protein